MVFKVIFPKALHHNDYNLPKTITRKGFLLKQHTPIGSSSKTCKMNSAVNGRGKPYRSLTCINQQNSLYKRGSKAKRRGGVENSFASCQISIRQEGTGD